jgi:hypothetical protein
VQNYPLDKPFIISTNPEGEIDWLPPDRTMPGFGPIYDDFTLQEIIEECLASFEIPLPAPFEEPTLSEEEQRGIKRKRED